MPTSSPAPVRRYPDLAIHRIQYDHAAIWASVTTSRISGVAMNYGVDFALPGLPATMLTERVRHLTRCRSGRGRGLITIVRADVPPQDRRECYEGIISGVTQRRLFIELEFRRLKKGGG